MQEIDEENRQLRDVVEMQSKKLKDLGRITKKNATSDFSCQFSTATCDFPCQYSSATCDFSTQFSSATCDFSTQFSPEMCDFSCVVYPNLNEDKVEDHLPATFHNDSAVKNDISADVGFGDGTEAETSGSFSQQTTNASPFALPSANNQTNSLFGGQLQQQNPVFGGNATFRMQVKTGLFDQANAALGQTTGFDNVFGQNVQTPAFSTPAQANLSANSSRNQTQASKYVCDCGYNAGKLKNRLTNHQKQFCKKRPRSVPTDLKCPICGIQNTYEAIKSHLGQFTRKGRINEARDVRHKQSNEFHQTMLDEFKANYGPKKPHKKTHTN